jgi:ribonuclease R
MYEGRVVEILKRGRNRFVGELRRQFDRWFVVPDGQTLHGPIFVPDAPAKRARPGDQVVVEITQFPSERSEARGVVVKVLGRRGEPGVDTLSIIEQYQLPIEFSDRALREVSEGAAAYDPESAARGREDLRGLTIITIDPDDAKDFDDAISITETKNGTMELGVHIADVSSFVPEDSALDEEVRERSTSVYLSGTVIPMLPETLSNSLCSLQEGEPRLTKSVFITYDRSGRVRGARFCNSVIRSTKRLTYREAQAILDGKVGRTGAKVRSLMTRMDALARAIQRRRRGEGMLTLDLPEAELVFDDDGEVVDVEPADTSFSHTIIEMFMVEANEAVARLLHKHRVPFLRRIHDAPDADSSDALERFLRVFGYRFKGFRDRQKVQALLDESSGRPDAFAIHLALLRSMERAEYSPLPIGHYALASDHYCHFTSPIRRYPDLTVHRLLDRYLSGKLKNALQQGAIASAEQLHELGGHCSSNERRAEAAERELKLLLILRLLGRRLGEALPGIITGVANVGLFVQLESYLVDGLVRLEDLGDDWWEVESAEGSIIGQRSGRAFRIGDRLSVILSQIDLPNRQLQLALTDVPRRPQPRRKPDGRKDRRRRRPVRQ